MFSLLCYYLSSLPQKYVLISHFWRDVCLSSFSCLGLQEIETEGLRRPEEILFHSAMVLFIAE